LPAAVSVRPPPALQDELAGIGHQAGIEIDDASVSELEQPNSLRPL